MKQSILLSILLLLMAGVSGQSGRVLESLVFESDRTGYPVKYSIYLPPDYEISQRSYPVLYLLHGYSDDETGWIQFGEANILADRGIANGDFPPCIIVMPDGKRSWYIDHYDGSDPWETMFITEFIPFIEQQYRIRALKEFRAIAGLSMGGNGALFLSMRHPEMFSSCVALSAAVFTDEEFLSGRLFDRYFGTIFGPAPKNGLVTDYWKSYSPLHLVRSIDKKQLQSIRFYIDCGDDDFLYKGNSALHVLMRELDIPHEYRVRDGAHRWSYWRTGLFDGLKFISEKFHR